MSGVLLSYLALYAAPPKRFCLRGASLAGCEGKVIYPWCYTCCRLGMNLKRDLAREFGTLSALSGQLVGSPLHSLVE